MTTPARDAALRFVLIMGVVNLFGDVTYEGGAAINGQFLGALGASAAVVSIVAGAGEFLGYSLRSVSGYVADRTGRYWLVTLIGYVVNLLAVPAMALVGDWRVAAALMLAERVGRAIRKPTVEAMISYTTGQLGRGWAYAVNTALDETGATLGPLLMALVLFLRGDYRTGYAVLLIAVVFALAALALARLNFPVPARLEEKAGAQLERFVPAYWIYMLAAAVFAAGLISYELVAFHLARSHLAAGPWIPVLLAVSTACGVAATLVLGKLFDRIGVRAVLIGAGLSALFTPLAFEGSLWALLLALPLWGVGYATQDTLLKAVVASVLPKHRRGLAFGLFYTAYGVGWLVGGAAAGLFYERSRLALVAFAAAAQLCSLPLFWAASRSARGTSAA